MDETAKNKAVRDRSPAFPFISLQAAIERLTDFDRVFGRHPTPANKVGLAWEMKENSSQAAQTLAALKYFGLLDYEGSGDTRKAFITEDGRTYLRAQQDEIKQKILKRLALTPKEISKFWEIWGSDRPHDAVCLDTLVIENKYNEKAAPIFIRVYDETIAFAGLRFSDKITPTGNVDVPEEEKLEELHSKDDGALTPLKPIPAQKRMDVMYGERVLQDGILSKDATYRIIVSGKIGPKEVERMIKKLELDKEILADSSEEDE